ncbi:Retrovirus-related Pol polyprotein from transposon TNT 1-94 [Capsicum baccatum]|uniref:Retrovirus-related Pol polyprotein from transposon TNT 1-94 n=1 Tax=Capsicum baccatum TaxID=33114 RepID=A0A2G2X115_CAPBA|nr:Retrovirus-related Pol polyprotein from transposon TNT 1-94 [Capsicum baccatum]
MSSSSNFIKINLKHWFENLMMTIIVRMLFGKEYDIGGQRARIAIRKLFKLLGSFVVADFIPSLRWFDIGGCEKEMKENAKETDYILENWLVEHKKKRSCPFLKAMLAGGTDSTVVALPWTLSLLLNNPHVMQKAQEELDIQDNVGSLLESVMGHYSCQRLDREEKGNMANVPYSSAVGSLMYAMECTRPDIAHPVGVVSRFLENPRKKHWEAVKWILRYLRGTSVDCLCFGGTDPILKGYTDADVAGDLDNKKSTTGYLFAFSGGAISWQLKLQKCVTLSTTEAEYIAATEAGKEMVWLKRRTPPKVAGSWRVTGHLHLFSGSGLPHKIFGLMADKYGPIFTVKFGAHQVLVVNDWKIAQDCLTINDKALPSRPKAFLGYNYAIFGLGPYWREMKKLVVLELLSNHRVQMFRHIR